MKTIKINKITDNIEYKKKNKRTIIDCSHDTGFEEKIDHSIKKDENKEKYDKRPSTK